MSLFTEIVFVLSALCLAFKEVLWQHLHCHFHWKTALRYLFSPKRYSICTKSFYQWKLIMHVGILFCKHSKVSMTRCRKCNYVLINVEVEILLTFLESMKVKVRLYQQYVSVFLCLHVKCLAVLSIHFRSIHLSKRIRSCQICWESTLNSCHTCRWPPYLVRTLSQ